MSYLIGLLTVVLVLDCILLILLVLIQLPKKEAGAGVAFGGAATDALFGAGTGNVLTKVTKYATVGFFALAVILGMLQSNYFHKPGKEFQRDVEQQGKELPAAGSSAVPAAPSSTELLQPAATNVSPPAAPSAAPQSAPGTNK